MTKDALVRQHERDMGVIEELNDELDRKDSYIKEQENKLYNLRKKRGVLNIRKAYMDHEILSAVRRIQKESIRIKFLTLIDKVLNYLHERF